MGRQVEGGKVESLVGQTAPYSRLHARARIQRGGEGRKGGWLDRTENKGVYMHRRTMTHITLTIGLRDSVCA